MLPLVIAYHLIWTGYGWWLPNDPRGSHSQSVRSDVLKDLGEVHLGRKKIQPYSHVIRDFYDEATDHLQHPTLSFTGDDRVLIAEAFGNVVKQFNYTCYACAIMPDHAHILIRKHKHTVEEMSLALHRESAAVLHSTYPHHPIWTHGVGWKAFLEHPAGVRRTRRYIEENPVKIGLPKQDWSFVKPYDNWPLHSGHNPSRPWARRLYAR